MIRSIRGGGGGGGGGLFQCNLNSRTDPNINHGTKECMKTVHHAHQDNAHQELCHHQFFRGFVWITLNSWVLVYGQCIWLPSKNFSPNLIFKWSFLISINAIKIKYPPSYNDFPSYGEIYKTPKLLRNKFS